MARHNLDNMSVDFFEDKGEEMVRIMHTEVLYGSFRNFTGIDTKFPSVDMNGNPKRWFNIAVPLNLVEVFRSNGIDVNTWNGSATDEDDATPFPGFIKVQINYNYSVKPIVSVRDGATNDDGSVNENWIDFTESTIGTLQRAEFDDASFIFRIARGVNQFGKPYVSFYLRKAWLTKHVEKPNMYEAEIYDYYGYNPNRNNQPNENDEPLPFK